MSGSSFERKLRDSLSFKILLYFLHMSVTKISKRVKIEKRRNIKLSHGCSLIVFPFRSKKSVNVRFVDRPIVLEGPIFHTSILLFSRPFFLASEGFLFGLANAATSLVKKFAQIEKEIKHCFVFFFVFVK